MSGSAVGTTFVVMQLISSYSDAVQRFVHSRPHRYSAEEEKRHREEARQRQLAAEAKPEAALLNTPLSEPDDISPTTTVSTLFGQNKKTDSEVTAVEAIKVDAERRP
jgi:hypothetical protein